LSLNGKTMSFETKFLTYKAQLLAKANPTRK